MNKEWHPRWKNFKILICINCHKKFKSPRKLTKFCSKWCCYEFHKINNKEIISLKRKKYRENNKEKIKKQKHKSYLRNRDSILKKCREWYINNKDRKRAYDIKYNKKNRLKKNKQQVERTKCDIDFRIKCALRKRIAKFCTNKSKNTMELLGCDIVFFKKHIESQFTDGMSWDNYGLHGWHIDHIIPCTAFNLKILNEQKKCFHYSNLQPLWASENISKGNKILKKYRKDK